MRYVYVCPECGYGCEVERSVADRDAPLECQNPSLIGWMGYCDGTMKRDFGATARTLIVGAPKFFCDSTRSDFEPSYSEQVAKEKSFEDMASRITKPLDRKRNSFLERYKRGERKAIDEVQQTRAELERQASATV